MKEFNLSIAGYSDIYDFSDACDDLFDDKHSNVLDKRPKASRGRHNHAYTTATKLPALVAPTKPPRKTPSIEATCKELFKDHDTKDLEKNSIVQDYIKRNKISDDLGPRSDTKYPLHPGIGRYIDDHNRRLPDINNVNMVTQKTQPAYDISRVIPTNVPDMFNKTPHHFTPKPPATAKPREQQQHHRRLYRSNKLEQDISIHNATRNFHKPRAPPEYTEIDYDKEIGLATEMQKEFENYHKSLNEVKKSRLVNGSSGNMFLHDADWELQICDGANDSGAGNIPVAASCKAIQPKRPWYVTNTHRGVGFRSKKNSKK